MITKQALGKFLFGMADILIIIHELCHTVIMKHTVRFQTLLRSHCPDCEQAQSWLDKYGNSL